MNHQTFFVRLCVILGFVLVSACSGAAPAPSPPTVQIIAPSYGASFAAGETVGVQAVSTDAQGVTRIELYVDGKLANTQLAPSPQGEKQFNSIFNNKKSALGSALKRVPRVL